MFESICIKRQNDFTGTPIDLGFLAEALLFYQNVHIVADRDIFTFLLRTCGIDVLLELLESRALTMTYLENGTGIRTYEQGTPRERHDFIVFESPVSSFQNVAPQTLQELTGKSGKGRRLAQRFAPLIKPVRFTQSLSEESALDLKDGHYLRSAISALLSYFVPEYQPPQPFTFDVIQEGPFVRLVTNIDFSAVNNYYHLRVSPTINSIT